ncbi:hypothetical protein NA56DRAFT_703146 [Hyaloscypha hepaticicola]|uniref:Uncharacterized protein n=1 Tax=Hyaloscypha hepaticicola TaxID=2082293 RepID=A0A2J6Q5E3_9HELO|nr:hypothetical protein NA56DRAFT_703146 [Hyaloscypha hepaticicola]
MAMIALLSAPHRIRGTVRSFSDSASPRVLSEQVNQFYLVSTQISHEYAEVRIFLFVPKSNPISKSTQGIKAQLGRLILLLETNTLMSEIPRFFSTETSFLVSFSALFPYANLIDTAKPPCVWITASRRQFLSSLRLWKRLQLAILLRGDHTTVFLVKGHEDNVNNKPKGFNEGRGRQLMSQLNCHGISRL